jgi:hypothetical protein
MSANPDLWRVSENYTSLFGDWRSETPRFERFRRFEMHAYPYFMNLLNERKHDIIAPAALFAERRSDTVFIFGSGYSIKAMDATEWRAIARHDTMSFNWFHYQRAIRMDYHVVRESYLVKTLAHLRAVVRHYCQSIVTNPYYAETKFLIQKEWRASTGNLIVGEGLLPDDRPICRFGTKVRGRYAPPSRSIEEGLVHGPGTLVDTINLAVIGGWTRIVLVGVDLYDRRYFWLGPDEGNRGREDAALGVDAPHNTVQNKVVEYIASWQALLQAEGRSMLVYNPRSLLSAVLPVCEMPERAWG